jgi:hypothetical protein
MADGVGDGGRAEGSQERRVKEAEAKWEDVGMSRCCSRCVALLLRQ